jgi:hypothetical protein
MRGLFMGMAAGTLALAGLMLAPARVCAQEGGIWRNQWEAHHQHFNTWRPQSHNKDYGPYGHHWLMGADGAYYYGNPNVNAYVPPGFWNYSYPVYPSYGGYYPSNGGYYPSNGGYYPSNGAYYYYYAP